MNKIISTIIVLLLFPLQAWAVNYAGIVVDFSNAPKGKSFVIAHKDGMSELLLHPATRLLSGDSIEFPYGLKPNAMAWLTIRLPNKTITIHASDSPWRVPSDDSGILSNIAEATSSLYGYLLNKKEGSNFIQAKSRGANEARLRLPFAVRQLPQLVESNHPQEFFWVGGAPPFSLIIKSSDRLRRVNNITFHKADIEGKKIYIGALLVNSEGCEESTVRYQLQDSKGAKLSFRVRCQFDAASNNIDEALLFPDSIKMHDGRTVSGRLLLWNASLLWPENSSRRALLRWMLVNGESIKASRF